MKATSEYLNTPTRSEAEALGHTPGPWHVVPGHSRLAVYASEREITWVGDAPYWEAYTAEHEANARLIASAPDLLAALKCARQYPLIQVFDGRDGKISKALYAIAQRDLDAIDTALDKATGHDPSQP